jgi:hypothetical protein
VANVNFIEINFTKHDICDLKLINNDFGMEERNKTLGEFIIENQNAFQYSSGELSRIINFHPVLLGCWYKLLGWCVEDC